MLATIVLSCYFTILGILCIYGLHRVVITRLYAKHAKTKVEPATYFEELPHITVQLPVFNEKYVVKRLIDYCAQLDYPKHKLQIQVLDDSTDETVELSKERVDHYRQQGLDIELCHRKDRSGFKAGALDAGLATAKGEFVAVFDADFVPQPDILRQLVHHFTDAKVGMVQARWEHLNRHVSTLTEVQAIMLDAHFMIEHGGRCAAGMFFNFNGTAGMWRKSTIADAGGWQHDTLTEDLDLSYRAQLRGWRFVFLPHVTCPAELPITMSAFKSQQHRWAKGSIQVMRKLLPTIWRAKVPLKVKIEATYHLTGNLAYVLMVINSLFFVIPSMMVRTGQEWWRILFIDGPLFGLASVSFIYFYMMSQRAVFGTAKGRKRFIPAIMAVGIGLGINNTRAVMEALRGKVSPFVRTPKLGEAAQVRQKGKTRKGLGGYRLPKSSWAFVEIGLGAMFTAGILWAIWVGNFVSIPFLVLFQNGFYFIGFYTLSDQLGRETGGPPVNDSPLETA